MDLDAKSRKEQASKAGKVSGKKRTAETKDRDKGIFLAFEYLEGKYQSQSDRLKAFKFLTDLGHGVKLSDGVAPARLLADSVGVTPARIWQIVGEARNKKTAR